MTWDPTLIILKSDFPRVYFNIIFTVNFLCFILSSSITLYCFLLVFFIYHVEGDTKKRELLKNPTKIEEIKKKNLLTEI